MSTHSDMELDAVGPSATVDETPQHTQQSLTQRAMEQAFEERAMARKRPPPTPAGSSVGTPAPAQTTTQPAQSGDAASTSLIQMPAINEQAAVLQTASHLGVNVNDQTAMQQWGEQSLSTMTVSGLIKIVQSYHTAVIRPEMKQVVVQVEAVIALSIFFLARELVQEESKRSRLTRGRPWVMAFVSGLLQML